MAKGLRRYRGKDRRRMRIKNKIAKQLSDPRYQQRKIRNKKRPDKGPSIKDWENNIDG